MKKLLYFTFAFLLVSFVAADNPLSKKERKYAVHHLKDSQKAVLKTIKGLSDAQLNFKPSADQWSIDGCVKHIAVSEKAIFGMIEEALKQPASPEKRANIKTSDEELVKMIESREKKVQTMDPLKPENTPFASTQEALASFNESREKVIDYVQSTKDDMRNHVVELPMGHFDAYQMLLFLSAHSARHNRQMEEIKAHPDFPKE